MRRSLGVLVILAVFALGTSSAFALKPAQAAGPPPLNLVQTWKSVACNVEQQTIRWYGSFDPAAPCPGPNVVNNPTDCPWDIDDSWTKQGEGKIETGQVVTAEFCAIADGTHAASVDAGVSAKHDQLIVSLAASDGRSWSAVPVKVGSIYRYVICADNLLQLFPHPEVPDSNGGQGTFVTYSLTIDATSRGGNGIGAVLDYGQGVFFVSGC